MYIKINKKKKKRHSPTDVCMLHYAFKFSLITDILQPIKMEEEKKNSVNYVAAFY